MLKFNILGPLEMVSHGRACVPTAPKVRTVLASLLVRAGQLVDISTLIEELWADEPPRSAVTTTQTYICQLRKKFEQELDGTAGDVVLETAPPGYILRLDSEQLDSARYDRLAAQGRAELERGEYAEAAETLRSALALWRGPVMANVPAGPMLAAHVTHLEETRIRTLESRIQADVELGRHRELIAELRSLTVTHPLNEWFHARLIDALRHTGRRGEALQAYAHVRGVLSDELGLEPSADLQRLQHAVLTDNDSDIYATVAPTRPVPVRAPWRIPAAVPAMRKAV